jgi:hypothetical protein
LRNLQQGLAGVISTSSVLRKKAVQVIIFDRVYCSRHDWSGMKNLSSAVVYKAPYVLPQSIPPRVRNKLIQTQIVSNDLKMIKMGLCGKEAQEFLTFDDTML